jgi:glycosyltransferase involved in cell wall biosynthesis
MPGGIYGRGYQELGSHCFAYIHATTVGGTHPALIEAMGRGALVLYRDTEENSEVIAGAGIPFGESDLAAKIGSILAMSDGERNEFRRRAVERVRERYSWDAVTADYERLFRQLAPARALSPKRRVGVDN